MLVVNRRALRPDMLTVIPLGEVVRVLLQLYKLFIINIGRPLHQQHLHTWITASSTSAPTPATPNSCGSTVRRSQAPLQALFHPKLGPNPSTGPALVKAKAKPVLWTPIKRRKNGVGSAPTQMATQRAWSSPRTGRMFRCYSRSLVWRRSWMVR
jgi:hypothetical protein